MNWLTSYLKTLGILPVGLVFYIGPIFDFVVDMMIPRKVAPLSFRTDFDEKWDKFRARYPQEMTLIFDKIVFSLFRHILSIGNI